MHGTLQDQLQDVVKAPAVLAEATASSSANTLVAQFGAFEGSKEIIVFLSAFAANLGLFHLAASPRMLPLPAATAVLAGTALLAAAGLTVRAKAPKPVILVLPLITSCTRYSVVIAMRQAFGLATCLPWGQGICFAATDMRRALALSLAAAAIAVWALSARSAQRFSQATVWDVVGLKATGTMDPDCEWAVRVCRVWDKTSTWVHSVIPNLGLLLLLLVPALGSASESPLSVLGPFAFCQAVYWALCLLGGEASVKRPTSQSMDMEKAACPVRTSPVGQQVNGGAR